MSSAYGENAFFHIVTDPMGEWRILLKFGKDGWWARHYFKLDCLAVYDASEVDFTEDIEVYFAHR